MKKAGMVMGIIAGSLVILLSLLMFFGIIVAKSIFNEVWPIGGNIENKDARITGLDGIIPEFILKLFNITTSAAFTIIFDILLIYGIILFIGGVLGLTGGIIIEKKNILAGVFMCIAAFFTICLLIPFIMFVISAVFAFIKEKKDAVKPAV